MDNFIHLSKINKNLCKDIFKYYLNNEDKHIDPYHDTKTKTAREIPISVSNDEYPFNAYKIELQKCIDEYRVKYPEVDTLLEKWGLVEDYNIQYYKPGQGFKKVHCERSCIEASKRVIVFMTYLNTVKNAGTNWPKQKFTSDCIIGNTVIWPTDWTHSHVGVINSKKDKCIITGWYSFYD
jgi:prolyl 4-hydroxylase